MKKKFDLICLDNLMCLGDESLNGTLNEKRQAKGIDNNKTCKEAQCSYNTCRSPE